MPLYEYACRTCGNKFDRMRPMAERLAAPTCPSCGAGETVLKFSTPGMVGTKSADVGPCGAPQGSCCGGACSHGH